MSTSHSYFSDIILIIGIILSCRFHYLIDRLHMIPELTDQGCWDMLSLNHHKGKTGVNTTTDMALHTGTFGVLVYYSSVLM